MLAWLFREFLGALPSHRGPAGRPATVAGCAAVDDAGDVPVEQPQERLRRGRAYAVDVGHSSPRRRGWGGAPAASAGRPRVVAVDEGREHVTADEIAGGGGERGAAAANNSTGPPQGDVVSVDRSARTDVGGVVVDVAARWGRGRGAAGESAWMTVGVGFPDETVMGRGSGGRSCGRGHAPRLG